MSDPLDATPKMGREWRRRAGARPMTEPTPDTPESDLTGDGLRAVAAREAAEAAPITDDCPTCGGRGWTLDADPLPNGEPNADEPYQVQCYDCAGSGHVVIGETWPQARVIAELRAEITRRPDPVPLLALLDLFAPPNREAAPHQHSWSYLTDHTGECNDCGATAPPFMPGGVHDCRATLASFEGEGAPESRSVQRRKAVQRGEPMPTFLLDRSRLREAVAAHMRDFRDAPESFDSETLVAENIAGHYEDA